jgi:hypothetical protein
MRRRAYRLPNGKFTLSVDTYARSWKNLAKPICGATGAKLVAFDPSIQIFLEDPAYKPGTASAATTLTLPVVFVERINKALSGLKF